ESQIELGAWPQQRPELGEVVLTVRGRNEPPACPKHAGELAEATVEIREVVEHPGGHGAVEPPVFKLEFLYVAEASVDSAVAGQLDPARRKIDGDHLGNEVTAEAFGELDWARVYHDTASRPAPLRTVA